MNSEAQKKKLNAMGSTAPATTAITASENDWQCGHKALSSRIGHLFTSNIFSDCTFLVGVGVTNQKLFSGHKMILATASPVFQTMFYGDFESKMPIVVTDVESDSFRALLEYIYLEKVPKFALIADAYNLYSACDKYCLPHLQDHCKEYILLNLYAQNVCEAFEFALLFDLSVILDKCKTIMVEQTDVILSSPSFMEIQPKTLLTIFDLNSANVESEMSFFRAFIAYVDKHDYDITKLKESIAEGCKLTAEEMNIVMAFGKIRFLTLFAPEFCKCMAEAKFISNDVALPILTNLLNSKLLPIPKGFCTERTKRNNTYHTECHSRGSKTQYSSYSNNITCPSCAYEFKAK